jgi:microcystin-dependent protein
LANSTPAPADSFYGPATSNTMALNPASVSIAGNNVPHNNIQPYLTINWCIAQLGIYPSRN